MLAIIRDDVDCVVCINQKHIKIGLKLHDHFKHIHAKRALPTLPFMLPKKSPLPFNPDSMCEAPSLKFITLQTYTLFS